MSRFKMMKACVVFLLWATAAVALPAQTFTTLVNFDEANGYSPTNISLVQGIDGNFYGTTVYGGAEDFGTVFKVTPGGTVTIGGAGARHRRQFLRDNGGGRRQHELRCGGGWLWYGLQDYSKCEYSTSYSTGQIRCQEQNKAKCVLQRSARLLFSERNQPKPCSFSASQHSGAKAALSAVKPSADAP
jgi:uncharacterized repeat protein (TIGR03803 family)